MEVNSAIDPSEMFSKSTWDCPRGFGDGMDEPEFVLSAKVGEPLRVFVFARNKPWHIRIDEFNLFVQVETDELPYMPPEDMPPELAK